MDMNKRMIKAFAVLNKAIAADLDKTFLKLSDKYHNLELSHNRKKKALMELSRIFSEFSTHCTEVEFKTDGVLWNEIRRIISDALFCDGRERERIKK